MRVLIIEDSEPVAALIADFIRPIARNIIIASSMEAAIRELSGIPPFDIITLDLNLPDSNALATLGRMAEIKEINPNCLLVVISGIASAEQEVDCIKLGADGFIRKAPSMARSGETFLGTLRDICRSIMRVPQRYQKNIAFLEELTEKIAAHCAEPNQNQF